MKISELKLDDELIKTISFADYNEGLNTGKSNAMIQFIHDNNDNITHVAIQDKLYKFDVRSKSIHICCLGDSITTGPTQDYPDIAGEQKTYLNYLPNMLDEKYGSSIHWVGTHANSTSDKLANMFLPTEAKGARSSYDVKMDFTAHARYCNADVIILHAGHNRDASRNTIDSIVKAILNDYQSIVEIARGVNNNVKVIILKVIPASKTAPNGRVEKYEYIPVLNSKLDEFCDKLSTQESPVYLVDCATEFKEEYYVHDGVHPNQAGAEFMANQIFNVIEANDICL